MNHLLIEVDGVSFRYGTQKVLQELSFTLEAGEYLVLTGENGSGKSTLLELVLGERQPETGRILLFGEPASQFHQWGKIGYLEQNGGAALVGFPASLLEIVTANLYSEIGRFRFPGKAQKEKAMAALDQMGLADYAGRMPSQLSGGQLQRALLARAMVAEPQLLLLDEPTTAMDTESTEGLYQQLERLHKQGLTILMITHDQEGASPYAQRMLGLKQGRLVPLERSTE